MILPETELSGALINAERFRAAVEQAKIACATDGNNVVRVTVSIGVAELQGRETLDLWFGRADKTLCRAKNAGRNQVCPAEALPIADR